MGVDVSRTSSTPTRPPPSPTERSARPTSSSSTATGQLVYRGRFDGSTPGNNVPLTGDELDAAVSALVAGEPISTDQRPSVGCSIKWKPGNEPADRHSTCLCQST